jgi:hypothetical protein
MPESQLAGIQAEGEFSHHPPSNLLDIGFLPCPVLTSWASIFSAACFMSEKVDTSPTLAISSELKPWNRRALREFFHLCSFLIRRAVKIKNKVLAITSAPG